MDINLAKVLAILVLGIGSLFFGLLPAAFNRYDLGRNPILKTILLCFGAGILLATSVVHMLPEVEKDIPDIAPIVFCCGFLLVYLADELLHLCTGRGHSHTHEESQPVLSQSSPGYGATGNSQPRLDHETQSRIQAQHEAADDNVVLRRQTLVGIVGMLTALSIHSFLEGLAIGIQSTTTRVMILFIAVVAHKLVVAFCLGVELSASRGSKFKHHFLVIFVFSAGSVVGIIVGMVLVNMSSVSNSKLLAVLQSIAAGTLLYVTLCEVLPRERLQWNHNRGNKFAGLIQLLAFSVGFSVMTLLNTYISDGD